MKYIQKFFFQLINNNPLLITRLGNLLNLWLFRVLNVISFLLLIEVKFLQFLLWGSVSQYLGKCHFLTEGSFQQYCRIAHHHSYFPSIWNLSWMACSWGGRNKPLESSCSKLNCNYCYALRILIFCLLMECNDSNLTT